MKKTFILAAAAYIAAGPHATYAVTKCVKLSSSATCTTTMLYKNSPYWTAVCNGTTVQGIAVCASNQATSIGGTTTPIISPVPTSNKYCTCRMVSPALSRWIRSGYCTDTTCYIEPTANVCMEYCAYMCATTLAGTSSNIENTTFKSNIFSNLSD